LVDNIGVLIEAKDEMTLLPVIENAVSQHRIAKEEAATKGKLVHEWC